ncbi:hypothetical protein VCR8J2_550022 [Vibrio coralliirubri]|nr:hypothetical protein VCR8J2_550022 [Vibrio coralliirubri]
MIENMVSSTGFAITRSIGVSHINVNDALIFCIERADKKFNTEKCQAGIVYLVSLRIVFISNE